METLRFKRLNDNVPIPFRAHPTDAGIDLITTVEIAPEDFVVFAPTGISVEIPQGYVGLLFARSSLCKRGWVMANGVGVIDSGYTGEIKVPLLAVPKYTCLEAGTRIAQLVIVPCETTFELEEVDELQASERGTGGFGSTGL